MIEGTLRDVEFDEGDNMGGMRGMRFCLVPWIDQWGHSVQGVALETTLLEGFDWITWRAVEGSANFNDVQSRGAGGTIWNCDYKQDIAGDTIEQRVTIDSATRLHVIAEVTDNNGKVRRMGERNAPAILTARHSSGGGPASLHGWTISIEAMHKHAAVFVPDWLNDPYDLELPGDDSSSG